MKKCVLATKDCVYLGYKIGWGGVRPEDSKIQVILEMSRPTTKKDVRTFLGMTGYYRRFFSGLRYHCGAPNGIHQKEITRTNSMGWQSGTSFQRLKQMLVSAPLIQNPDFARTFILQTNASEVRVGAVLSQGEEEDRPIAYFSRKLLPRERAFPLWRRNA